MTPRRPRLARSLLVALLLAAVAAAVDAQRRPFGAPAPSASRVPLLAGPPSRAAWRVPRRYGLELPLAVDQRLLAAGLGSTYRVILPRVSRPAVDVELVVEAVEAEAAAIPEGGLAGVRSAIPTGGVVYTGTVAGGRGSVAVLSVISDVLYGRLVAGEDVWVLFSDSRGRPFVRLEQRPPVAGAPGTVAPLLPDRMVPASQRRRPPR